MFVNIFKPDTIDYSDLGYSKPIRYSDDFLKRIADVTGTVSLNEEHTDKVIGELSDFVFQDGFLSCNVNDDVDVTGKGISPKFSFDLVEYDEFFLAVDGELIDAGLTCNPRSHIVCNSIKGDDMTEDLLKREMERNAELERKLAKKDSELLSLQEKLEDYSNLEKTVSKLQKENSKFSSEFESLKEKADAYDERIAEKKTILIQKVADGDEERQKQLQEIPYKDLEVMYDVWQKNSASKGVGTDEGLESTPQPKNDASDDFDEVADMYNTVFGKELSTKYE